MGKKSTHESGSILIMSMILLLLFSLFITVMMNQSRDFSTVNIKTNSRNQTSLVANAIASRVRNEAYSNFIDYFFVQNGAMSAMNWFPSVNEGDTVPEFGTGTNYSYEFKKNQSASILKEIETLSADTGLKEPIDIDNRWSGIRYDTSAELVKDNRVGNYRLSSTYKLTTKAYFIDANGNEEAGTARSVEEVVTFGFNMNDTDAYNYAIYTQTSNKLIGDVNVYGDIKTGENFTFIKDGQRPLVNGSIFAEGNIAAYKNINETSREWNKNNFVDEHNNWKYQRDNKDLARPFKPTAIVPFDNKSTTWDTPIGDKKTWKINQSTGGSTGGAG